MRIREHSTGERLCSIKMDDIEIEKDDCIGSRGWVRKVVQHQGRIPA